jgi:multidrug efflux pump subunit AcrA (membrane-fusion protein)
VRLDALNTYRTVYTLASDAIYNKTDSLFDAARTSAPQLNINPFGETELETERALINDILLDWSLSVESATRDSNSRVLLEEAYEDVSAIKSFLDRLSVIVNRQTTSGARAQTTIDAEKAAVLSARSNVDSALASIASAQDSLEENLEADSGGTGESDAALASARADVSSAQAALSKTVIRAPISGTINMLAIERGNTVSASEPAVRIANNQALEVRTYISSEERDFIHVGMPVTLEGSIEAVVTKIAPALDPQTKKIEVRIGVADSAAELVNGASVRLSLIANGGATDADGALSIPLSAIKLSGTEPRVFSVSSENTLVAHTVELGDVRGSAVEIHGIDPSLFIVTDARGLKAGERVTVLE